MSLTATFSGDQPLDRNRSRHFRVGHRLLGLGALLPRDLDVDRGLVDTPLTRDPIRVRLQSTLSRRLQPGLARPIPARVCLRRLTHWGPPLPEFVTPRTVRDTYTEDCSLRHHGSDIVDRSSCEHDHPNRETRESDDREHP